MFTTLVSIGVGPIILPNRQKNIYNCTKQKTHKKAFEWWIQSRGIHLIKSGRSPVQRRAEMSCPHKSKHLKSHWGGKLIDITKARSIMVRDYSKIFIHGCLHLCNQLMDVSFIISLYLIIVIVVLFFYITILL